MFLKNLLGIPSQPKSPISSPTTSTKSVNVKREKTLQTSCSPASSGKVSKTELLKQQLNVSLTPSKVVVQSTSQTPPASAKQSKKPKRSSPVQIAQNQNDSSLKSNSSGKANSNSSNHSKKVISQTPKGPRFAGSAFENSPHPDHIPLPNFDENMF